MAIFPHIFDHDYYGHNSGTYHYRTRQCNGLQRRIGFSILMKKHNSIPKRLFNIEEASIYLGRTPNAIRQMIWDGKFRYVKDGKRILLDVKDMDDFIEQHKTIFEY